MSSETIFVPVSLPCLTIKLGSWKYPGEAGYPEMATTVAGHMRRDGADIALVYVGGTPEAPGRLRGLMEDGGVPVTVEFACPIVSLVADVNEEGLVVRGFTVLKDDEGCLRAEMDDFARLAEVDGRTAKVRIAGMFTLAVTDCVSRSRDVMARSARMASATVAREKPGTTAVVAAGPDRQGRYRLMTDEAAGLSTLGVEALDVDEETGIVTLARREARALMGWLSAKRGEIEARPTATMQ